MFHFETSENTESNFILSACPFCLSASLTGSDAGSAVRQVFPDIGVLFVGLLTWRLIVRLNPHIQVSYVHTHRHMYTQMKQV